MKLAIVLGTRPEIIKLAPIIKKLNNKNSKIIFTGQHFDYNMGLKFINELGIRKPDYSFKISHSNAPIQISQMISKITPILKKIMPDSVLVQGDTNTVLASSIASLKCSIPISHIESGLRSFDWRMPEEHNRIVTDHMSEYLFTPTQISKKNLISEKVHGKIFVTGNTVIDSIQMFSKISSKKSQLQSLPNDFALMTLHRSENVDDKNTLTSILKAAINSNQQIIFPIHPRTLKRLNEFNLYQKISNAHNIELMQSVGYFEILELMKKCLFIITDSGGIQEEATSPIIHKKVIVVRKTTDRPEAVKAGYADLIGTSYSKILAAIKKTSKNPSIRAVKSPYGTGNSSKQIIQLLKKEI